MKKRTLREQYLFDKKKDKLIILAIQIAVLVLFFGLWELLARTGAIDSFITSCPSRMLKTLKLLARQDLFKHMGITLLECVRVCARNSARHDNCNFAVVVKNA